MVNTQQSLYEQIPNIQKKIALKNIRMTSATRDRYLLYAFGWISMRTTCHLGLCPVYTFNGSNSKQHDAQDGQDNRMELAYCSKVLITGGQCVKIIPIFS